MDGMTRIRTAGLAVVLLALTSCPARADITAFLGANTTPANRPVRGQAVPTEHPAIRPERVGRHRLAPGREVRGVDRLDPFRMLQVPSFAGLADGQAGSLELGTHGAVADDDVGVTEREDVHR